MVFLLLVAASLAIFVALGLVCAHLVTLRSRAVYSDLSVLAEFELEDGALDENLLAA